MRLLILLLLLQLTAFAKVWTYPSPRKEIQTSKYEVTVYQIEESLQSFIYQDKNSDEKLAKRMTDFNHLTTYSFEGPVQIEVRLLDAAPNGSPTFTHLRSGHRLFQRPSHQKQFLKNNQCSASHCCSLR